MRLTWLKFRREFASDWLSFQNESTEAAFEGGLIADAIIAENIRQARDLWHIRESITLAQAEEGFNVKHDISIPISLIPDFVCEADSVLAAAIDGVRFVNFGHLGDGNLHYNIQAPENMSAKDFVDQFEEQISSLVYDTVCKYQGSISAEHGIGALKVQKLTRYARSHDDDIESLCVVG